MRFRSLLNSIFLKSSNVFTSVKFSPDSLSCSVVPYLEFCIDKVTVCSVSPRKVKPKEPANSTKVTSSGEGPR